MHMYRAIIQMCQWWTTLVIDHVLGPDRKVFSLCCSVSSVIEAFRYVDFVWGKVQGGSTWWCRRGVVKKTGWSVGESDLWPTTWMDSLSSSPEDKHHAEAVSMTIRKGRAGRYPSHHAICSWSAEDSSGWAQWGEAKSSRRMLNVNKVLHYPEL